MQLALYRQLEWTRFDAADNVLGKPVDNCLTDAINQEYGDPPADHFSTVAVSLCPASLQQLLCLSGCTASFALLASFILDLHTDA